jgi:hypothetical protein
MANPSYTLSETSRPGRNSQVTVTGEIDDRRRLQLRGVVAAADGEIDDRRADPSDTVPG